MEEWRPVPGFPTYEVSSHGHVRHINRPFKHRATRIHKKGYLWLRLCKNARYHQKAVHRLVVDAFLGGLPPGMSTNHKNGIKTDNRLENLEIMSPEDNTRHSFRELGRQGMKGSMHHKARLTEADIPQIIALHKTGMTLSAIASLFPVAKSTIHGIVHYLAWQHVVRDISPRGRRTWQRVTPTQRDHMRTLIGDGLSYAAVGKQMHLNETTVARHAPKHIYGP